jgi:hypothetical protein
MLKLLIGLIVNTPSYYAAGASSDFWAATAPSTRAILDTGASITPSNIANNSLRPGIEAKAFTPFASNVLPLNEPALITRASFVLEKSFKTLAEAIGSAEIP